MAAFVKSRRGVVHVATKFIREEPSKKLRARTLCRPEMDYPAVVVVQWESGDLAGEMGGRACIHCTRKQQLRAERETESLGVMLRLGGAV